MVPLLLYSGRYVTRALKLFFGEDKKFVTIKAADRLIERALWVAEVIKRRVEGLHQVIELKEHEVVDVYEPREEGLVRVEQKRFLTVVEVTLTKEPTAAQKGSAGYQAPLKLENAEFLSKEKWEEQEKNREERRNKPREAREPREPRENRDNKRRGEQRTRGNNKGRR